VLCVVALASATVPPPARPVLTVWQQVQRQCRHLARERLAPYPWPLAPLHRQHPVRGDFGDPRTASRTLLGTVRPRWNHVHLAEFRSNCAVNPLARGHLTPYRDTTKPTVAGILVASLSWDIVRPDAVRGRVRILADAFDTPALPSAYPWGELPVAPAHVAWRLTTLGGELVAHNTAADFRYGEPPRRELCSVYAPGTRQNFAAVAGRFHWGQGGRYLFDLTPRTLDTSRLPPGAYRITVTASDTAGNVGTASRVLTIQRAPASGPTVTDTRCAGD
jgi:hypothetical protein